MKKSNAFTLVELIIVISIIALLATLGISTYSSIQKDARNVRRKADLKELKTALEAYKAKNSDYPTTVGVAGCTGLWCGICANYNTTGTITDTGLNGYIPNLASEFIPKLPRDPRESKPNSSSDNTSCNDAPAESCYLYKSNGTDYKIIAICTPEGHLVNSDPYFDPTRYCGASGSATCAAGGGWAWQVSSSNLSVGW